MIRHLLKLTWNRKGPNFLIMLEVFASFLVVFALAATGLHLAAVWQEPLGFDWHDVWTISLDRNSENPWTVEDSRVVGRLLETARSHPEVVFAAASSTVPYGGSVYIHSWKKDGRKIESEVSTVTPGFKDAMRLDLVSGRWFQPGDETQSWIPIVIDRELAEQLVGDGDPLQARIEQEDAPERRVIGVVRDFRRGGEVTEDMPFTLMLASPDHPKPSDHLESLVIRLAPGTTAAFEESLLKTLEPVARGWSLRISHMDEARAARIRETLLPVGAIGLVAALMLFMVVLGLTGVMWHNVTRRTREFGLRRAVGAHRGRIHRQIVGEVVVLAGLGILAGSALAVQVPLFGPFTFVRWTVVAGALLVATAVIVLLAAVCGLYPGWGATRVHPAEALHYE